MKTYYLYEKTSPKGLKYLGVTSNENPSLYPGSGVYWRRHLQKHEILPEEVETKILCSTHDKSVLREKSAYYSKLYNVVESDLWANLIEEDGVINDFPRTFETKKYLPYYTTELIEKIEARNSSIKKDIFYRNMDNVRKSDVTFIHTREEVAEYGKCAINPIYFFENYCKLMTVSGYSFVSFRSYQKTITTSFFENRFNIIASSRQSGMSVLSDLLALHESIFNSEKSIVITGTRLDSLIHNLNFIKDVYKNLPFFLKPGVTKYSNNEICFDNGSRIVCKNKNMLRGFGIDTLFVHDFAYMTENDTKEVSKLFPILASNKYARIFISSAPNGINHFYELYSNAGRKDGDPAKNLFVAHSVYWWEVPGRDAEWREREIVNLGSEALFNQSYDLQFFPHSKRESN